MLFGQERNRLLELIGGIRHLKKIPDVLFIIGVREAKTAIHEAQRKHVPIVAVCDTNDNPDEITHVIPANDDAVKSIRMLADLVAEAVLEGKDTGEAAAEASAVAVEEEVDVHDLNLRQVLPTELEKLDEDTDKEQHESKLKLKTDKV